jgi:citrate synthase
MEKPEPTPYMQSRIWLEEPEADNPFTARTAYCHGYDVYGRMLGQAGWAEMVYLLFQGERPSPGQRAALEILAVALANAGPRDPSVHAAMCGGVGGSVAAASLMAALAAGAGSCGGAREVRLAVEAWQLCDRDLERWQRLFSQPSDAGWSVWPAAEHPPGFDPHGSSTATPVRQTLRCLAALNADSRVGWSEANLTALEQAARHPLSMTGVAAAALADLGLEAAPAEMLFLLLRLPGAAAHALEQQGFGHKRFPWYAVDLEVGPTSKER